MELAKSTIISRCPEAITLSINSSAMDWITPRSSSTLRGVNATEQRLRRRECIGSSMNNICCRIISANGFMKESPKPIQVIRGGGTVRRIICKHVNNF